MALPFPWLPALLPPLPPLISTRPAPSKYLKLALRGILRPALAAGYRHDFNHHFQPPVQLTDFRSRRYTPVFHQRLTPPSPGSLAAVLLSRSRKTMSIFSTYQSLLLSDLLIVYPFTSTAPNTISLFPSPIYFSFYFLLSRFLPVWNDELFKSIVHSNEEGNDDASLDAVPNDSQSLHLVPLNRLDRRPTLLKRFNPTHSVTARCSIVSSSR